METEPIEDFVLGSEHNLRIAAAVYDAWPKARQKIVDGFLDRLGSRLKHELKEWEFGPWGGNFFEDTYPGYACWKPAWVDQYGIGLQCLKYGESMVFGVYREKENIGSRPFCDELLQAISKLHPSARQQAWWEARMTMHSPTADWRTPDVLWRIHKDAAFLEEVALQLLEVAKVSEKILDREARKK